MFQTSPESPVIFTLLHKIFSEESIDELKEKALKQLSDEDFKVSHLTNVLSYLYTIWAIRYAIFF